MFHRIRGFFAAWFRALSASPMERYLSAAADAADFERRMQAIETGTWRQDARGTPCWGR